ncbi:MAG: RNA 2',3'-cyclic phosphodiesterase [Terrimicrobiaceae bacterium]
MAKRLFIAIELPESCRERLERVQRPIRGVRWIPSEHLHFTLAFLGDVSEEAERLLLEKLSEVRIPPFVLPIEGVGTFGGAHPSVLWAGVGTGHPHLFALHKRVHDALLAAHFDFPLRSFHPHVTLARLKNVSAQTLRPLVRMYESDEFDLVEVSTFSLVSSKPGPEGSLYTVERRYDLIPLARSPATA